MKPRSNMLTVMVTATLSLVVTAFSCTKPNEAFAPSSDNNTAAAKDVSAAAVNSTWSVNWDNRTTGTYSSADANTDFGNISGWNASRAYISNGSCRITLLKNALSGAGGLIGNIDVADGEAYEMDYDIRFHSQFDWSRGGKVGFGFLVGEGNTGGDPGWDGNGGSLRLMWYSSGPGRVYFQPYVYYKDQPGDFGDTFGKSYPATGSLNKGQTYHVHLYIKSNTGSNKNGHVQIVIDGTVVLDTDIRWTTNDSQRLIKKVAFHTFRGGSQTYWQSDTDGYIYYDNLTVHKIN
ncbi:polysaccharide lyase [Chitinophaga nivalis]|uniref:Polysaccharide lyase 14 domain-containing protein n=1 Tax=Chitinophaga nivalis TaxID=2991709 RepID=A0ABT3IFG0_9BACT|nr:hypothetical protein [Chitinophaga nivalis]MCW3467662.1 hypothetical protein [Chitinophaga nivalis]MCW3482646.1 hypothetical protein [Chitinophaga nivalis]